MADCRVAEDKQSLRLRGQIRKITQSVWRVCVCEPVHVTFHQRYGCVGWERESWEEKKEEGWKET